MSNNKQSSNHLSDVGKKVSCVEVLFSEMYNIISFYAGNEQDALCERIKQQAEAMHEGEVKNAYVSGYLDNGYYEGAEEDAAKLWEDTYGFVHKETFNNNEQ